MRISDWSSDVCSSDLGASPDHGARHKFGHQEPRVAPLPLRWSGDRSTAYRSAYGATREFAALDGGKQEHCTRYSERRIVLRQDERSGRSEEHTTELQSLMRNSYAVCCLKNKTNNAKTTRNKSQVS